MSINGIVDGIKNITVSQCNGVLLLPSTKTYILIDIVCTAYSIISPFSFVTFHFKCPVYFVAFSH